MAQHCTSQLVLMIQYCVLEQHEVELTSEPLFELGQSQGHIYMYVSHGPRGGFVFSLTQRNMGAEAHDAH